MFTFGIVVEGVYDEHVIIVLIKKIFSECECLCRITGGIPNLTRKFPGFLEDFRYRSIDKALVVRDAHRKPLDLLYDQMKEKVQGRNYPFPLRFCIIKEEMEVWLLADEKALSKIIGIDVPRFKEDFESIETPKEKLVQILSQAKINYTPDVARKIAEAANIDTMEYRCPEFKSFRESVLHC
ncbi:MAG: DUF4276 family protein [Pseudomonadota bacterium]